MGLMNHKWEDRYEASRHDLVNDFLIYALKNSKRYCRITGYFSSSLIAAAAEGISYFINTGEKMYMIIGNAISEDDVLAIHRGLTDIEILEKKWEDCLLDINGNVDIKNSFEALAWLVAHDKLEIKIGVNVDGDGTIIPSGSSIFHEKIMIFEDDEGNSIQTDGSANETMAAFKRNRESFSVHRSWVPGQAGYVESSKSTFWGLWNGTDSYSRVYDMPRAMKEGLISMAPSEFPLYVGGESPVALKVKKLRKYQLDAINAWKNAGKVGILEMATGTGKTITALTAVSSDFSPGHPIVIIVPQLEIANQWAQTCRDIFGVNTRILECHSENKGWKSMLPLFFSGTKSERRIVITIDKTYRGNDFRKVIKRYLDNIILICDEVHGMGSPKNIEIFGDFERIPIRLGLSATPKRHWDEEGNIELSRIFGAEPVFTYGLDKAINPDEGYEKCLCDYNYYFHTCSLNEDEREEYEELTLKIARLASVNEEESTIENKELSLLLIKRSNIINGCKDRVNKLIDIVNAGVIKSNKCIIYCQTIDEIDFISKKLSKVGYPPLKYHSKISNREEILRRFSNGDVKYIISVGCLDQGIDIPSCDGAIIMSSSQNPREYVQRRGRVLRLSQDKKTADIHDFVVLPYPLEDIKRKKVYIDKYDCNMILRQLNRVEEFTSCASNRVDVILKRIELIEAIR